MGFPWVIDEVINAATILSRLLWFPYGWMFMVLGHYWRSVPPDDVIIIHFQFQVVEQWVWCINCVGSLLLPKSIATWTSREFSILLKEESSCRGLFDYGTVGVCVYVGTYILTLERGDRSGYLILLPLLHRLKVMDDGVHVTYTLWHVLHHKLYDACQVSYDAFIS